MNKHIKALSDARKNAEGIIDGGKLRVVLYRQTVKSSTDPCPFCGRKHTHGIGDGDRTPHCYDYDAPYVLGRDVIFKNKDGLQFSGRDDYYIKTRFPEG